MSREDFDIPEVFRRAMEEKNWGNNDEDGGKNGNGGDNGGDGRPPRPSLPIKPFWKHKSFWLIAGVLILFLSFNWIITTYTEWLWFDKLDYRDVWIKQWGVGLIAFLIAFVIAAAIYLLNWQLARKRAIAATPPYNFNLVKEIPGMGLLINAVGLFFAFAFASAAGNRASAVLRYVYRVPYGEADPIFNKDLGFYLFELPIYNFLQEWLMAVIVIALLGVVFLYALNYIPELRRGRWRPHQLPVLRQHVALLGAIMLLVWALGYWLDVYGLLYSPRGVVYGASYTDMNATLWALRVQMALALLTALALLYNVFRTELRPLAVIGGLWIAAVFVLGGILPGLQQRYVVEPNEIERERPYITNNIKYTRMAYDLDKIETRAFDKVTDLTQKDVDENDITLRNVRLWDYRPLRDTYEQLQALRPYYHFSELDIDRYIIDGEERQVMLGAREMNKANLPSRSWVNANLEFTHGYGVVMNPVNRVTSDGQPEFFIKDLPPQSSIDLEVTRPEVYYGETDGDIVFVSSGREEFDYPSGNDNVYSTYQGTGGVKLDSFLKRLAFAFRLKDINVLLSDDINSGTRIQYHRLITERVQQITPFLALDDDPYLIVWDGRLVWMYDAFTVSNRFPYSTPSENGRYNYIRNGAKIIIDAYNGDVTYYMADTEDPIIQTYANAFPGLFHDLEEMPESLRDHIRYPEDLFVSQMHQYLTYHMTDVRVFYNKEDKWDFPQEIFEGSEQLMEPYYVTMTMPGEENAGAEYLLILPFTPASRNNMIAWVAARNDPEHYGELVVYELPKQELVFGPMQIEGRIDQEPSISEQFSLWDQRGSRIIRGNLLVLPMNNSFLYVEPVYLLSDTSSLPELKRVIVATSNRTAMLTTLDDALASLLGGVPLETLLPDDPIAPDTDGGETTTAPLDADREELIISANAHLEAAEAAQQAGDWATYGVELDALRSDLERLLNLSE